MRNWFFNFMQGRYGFDKLSQHMMVAGVVPLILSMVLRMFGGVAGIVGTVFYFVALAMIVICVLRMFSRNTQKRYAENARYLKWYAKAFTGFSQWRARMAGRKQFRYFKCPSCGTRTRIPRGVGSVTITCPKCGTQYKKKA